MIYTIMKNSLFIKASTIGVVLNILLALILSPFATKDEIKPPNGASKLSFKSQIMHMLVHHGQVLFSSSLIIAVLVGLSVCIAQKI
jgi:hypothetical protein